MGKPVQNIVITIGVVSILAGIYSFMRSGKLVDALSGVLIGVSLIVAIMIERNRNSE